MKAKAVTYLLLAGLATGVVACSNDDDATPNLQTSQLVLVNDTSGMPKNAGTVKINELSTGGISMELALKDSFRLSTQEYPPPL